MEQQVAEAALAMVRPTTDSQTRSAASSFLEQWTLTPEAWAIYVTWLQSFHAQQNSSNPDIMGMQLLCLTLLQAKIRRDVIINSKKTPQQDAVLSSVRNEILSLLQLYSSSNNNSSGSDALIGPLCSCLAGLIARSGSNGVSELVGICRSGDSTSLKLLASLPPEMEVTRLATPQVTEILLPHMETVLHIVQSSLVRDETTKIPALRALRNWAKTGHITLTRLSTPTYQSTSIFSILIQILAYPQPETPNLVIMASQALTEAILVPTDSCTPQRTNAVAHMMSSISRLGFISAPLAHCTRHRENNDKWDDAAHALGTLISTLITEEIDELVGQPADSYMRLLLEGLQQHPHTPVALTVLDVWLTVQDVPTSERHEHWKAPLFTNISLGLLQRLSYTNKSFVNWEEELEMDKQQFTEFRQLVKDILENCYFILRVEFLRKMAAAILHHTTGANSDWTMVESALFCLVAVSREVNARIRAKGNAAFMVRDKTETAKELLQLVQGICNGGGANSVKAAAQAAAQQHPLVLLGIVQFIGSYAPTWGLHCSHDDIIQLIGYAKAAGMILGSQHSNPEEAAKTIRSIYISCTPKLLEKQPQISRVVQEVMGSTLESNNLVAMSSVAEGSTRLIVQMSDQHHAKQTMDMLTVPLYQRADNALQTKIANGSTPNLQTELAMEALSKYLNVMQVIVRFCVSETVPLWIHNFMDKVVQHCGEYESVLTAVLEIKKQFLTIAPLLVAPHFSETIQFVVRVFETTKNPAAIDYLSSAVENFNGTSSNSPVSSSSADAEALLSSFTQLLSHVSRSMITYTTTTKRPDECPSLVESYFQMVQRFILFCPLAMFSCTEFNNVVAYAVDCLSSCRGERESTRATLNFLSQLFGWRSLRLSDDVQASLESKGAGAAVVAQVDQQLAIHGKKIIRFCFDGLSGHSPQMLWPALSDCVFAIISHVVITAPNASSGSVPSSIAHEWVLDALVSSRVSNGTPVPPVTCKEFTVLLFGTVQAINPNHPSKAKAKAKLILSDFARYCKAEITEVALLSSGNG